MLNNVKIAVIGLGYVGLPLATIFSKKFDVIGYDISESRIKNLNNGTDKTLEVSDKKLEIALKNGIKFSAKVEDLKECNFYIIAVPTPVDKNNRPDLTPLLSASKNIASVLKKGDIVVYESTVYPGATEEECVPVLEKYSNLKFNEDFFCGYSPERINPGDKKNTLTNIQKITSGSTPQIAEKIDKVYLSIIEAGTFKASSIKVAEAAKVIENTQRDINIAFVNELAMIFEKIGIDTTEVLKAAGTKWNFLKFTPGLVGGHCIGVDPYYLTHKAQELGYHPEIILAGRRINDNMGKYVANRVIKLMIKHNKKINKSNVLVLGITFKENCTDIRNSKVIDLINELKDFGCNVDVFDPWADEADVSHEYGISLSQELDLEKYEAIVLAVAHNEFKNLDLSKTDAVTFDIKGILEDVDGRL